MSGHAPSGRRRAKPHEEEEHENHERWLVSFADMMTLLTAVFIVLYSISQVDQLKFAALAEGLSESFGSPTSVLTDGSPTNDPGVLDAMSAPIPVTTDYDPTERADQRSVDLAAAQAAADHSEQVQAEAQATFDQLRAAQQAIEAALAAAGQPDAVEFTIDERGLVVHVVADQVLFGPEQAGLRTEGAGVLDALAPTLAALPNQLRIEGHTNSLPVTPGGPFPSNWELSTARATTVLRHLAETDGLPEARLSAAGFAATRPLLADSDPASVSVNRRVDIVVLSDASTEANAQLPGLAAEAARTAGATPTTTVEPATVNAVTAQESTP
ncbi:flagellar motor protein MotB [Modestobacter sp. Leaf380]|uniref:OmpA/MotB family protein n=1 Tax=Modestobacter sp. Leaf380 TaxID=1736356 RepID=UPI0009EA3863|nr:flagellar motor protein MotB [Modestobacter sp. Leaf380]